MFFTPFHRVPTALFLKRVWPLVLGGAGIGFVLVGPLASSGWLVPAFPTLHETHNTPWSFYQGIVRDYARVPSDCEGQPEGATEQQVCSDILGRLHDKELLGSFPLALLVLLFFLSFRSFRGAYQRGQKGCAKRSFLSQGTATNPPLLPVDVYAWFHCFRVVSVELSEGQQIKVYVPWEMAIPKAGETLAVYDERVSWGARRPIAALYAPHVAVYGKGR